MTWTVENNTSIWALLSEEQRDELRRVPDSDLRDAIRGGWSRTRRPEEDEQVYRSIEKTKPSVDWSALAPEITHIARVSDSGSAYAFDTMPVDIGNQYATRTGRAWRIDGLVASYDPGTCHWRNSIVRRPA